MKAFAFLALLSTVASAQEAAPETNNRFQVELGGEYGLLNQEDIDSSFGGDLRAYYNVMPELGLGIKLGYSRFHPEAPEGLDQSDWDDKVWLNATLFNVAAQYRFLRTGNFTLAGNVDAGIAHLTVGMDDELKKFFEGDEPESKNYFNSAFGLQGTYWINDNFGVSAQTNYRVIFPDESDTNLYALYMGLGVAGSF